MKIFYGIWLTALETVLVDSLVISKTVGKSWIGIDSSDLWRKSENEFDEELTTCLCPER